MSFVYMIRQQGTPLVKIGVARDPVNRLGALQTGNPEPLELVATVPGDEKEEETLHWFFDHYRKRGEWFEDRDSMIEFWFHERLRTKPVLLNRPPEHAPTEIVLAEMRKRGGIVDGVSAFKTAIKLPGMKFQLAVNTLVRDGAIEKRVSAQGRVTLLLTGGSVLATEK